MPETFRDIAIDFKSIQEIIQQIYKFSDTSSRKTTKWNRGLYNIEDIAQDQVIIRIVRGSKIDMYRGLHVATEKDSQSDYTYPTSRFPELNEYLRIAEQSVSKKIYFDWEPDSKFIDDYFDLQAELEEQIDVQIDDTITDDISQWSSDELTVAILNPHKESDLPHLREMIMIAEDTSFTPKQSKQLAPWFINFANKYCDSNDPQNEAPVLSAIRTGASMLRPHKANLLIPLLEPGHSIETSLVTIKMIGRIFEAQPPTEIDKYKDLVDKVYPAADIVRNPFSITISKSAALAQLAIYALSAMASSKTLEITKFVKQSGITWFIQQTLYDLRELKIIWLNHNVSIASQSYKLLGKIIKTLEGNNSSAFGENNASK